MQEAKTWAIFWAVVVSVVALTAVSIVGIVNYAQTKDKTYQTCRKTNVTLDEDRLWLCP